MHAPEIHVLIFLILMDLTDTINLLRTRHQKILDVIKELESLGPASFASPPRRGRKSMGEAERRDVSVRMKRYWASRRKVKAAAQ